MQAITLRREHRHGGAQVSAAFEHELMTRLRPLVDTFTDDQLERMDRGRGPLVYALVDEDGLPVSGVVYDPETDRRTRFRFPIAGQAVA